MIDRTMRTIPTIAMLVAICVVDATVLSQAPLSLAPRSQTTPTAARVRGWAAEIDRLVEADLRARGGRPQPLVDDDAFARRAWLLLAGRIPTPAELDSFAADRSPGRRTALVDVLLDAPGYDSAMFHFWADLLRAKSRLAPQASGEPYLHFLRESIAADVPYDEVVRQLLTATGPAHARGNGATGYALRDRGMP